MPFPSNTLASARANVFGAPGHFPFPDTEGGEDWGVENHSTSNIQQSTSSIQGLIPETRSDQLEGEGSMLKVGSRRSMNLDFASPARGKRAGSKRFMEGGRRWRGGFSLIEMLVTLALMLILMVMFYSRGSKSFQRRQKEACQKNLQTIYVALQTYANEHDGRFPSRDGARTSEEALAVLVPRYTSVTEPFTCPGTKKTPLPEGESFEKRRISYAYYMGRRVADAAEVLMTDRKS